jgi:IclR family acetate operon transcriptional repressor
MAQADPSEGPLRSVRVLEALAGMEQPASLDVIIEKTGLTKSKAFRSLAFLQDAGFVDHVGRLGYRIGSRSLALATLMGPRPALLRTARPVMRWLADLTSESATLHLRSGNYRVLVVGAEARGERPLGTILIGERAPLTSGCSGTVILAHLPSNEIVTVVKSRPRRERRPTSSQLAAIREEGYALSFSDNHAGMNGIAAPLISPSDHFPLGSIAIAGAESRLPEMALRQLSEPLKKACKQLAPQLARMVGPSSSQRLASLDVSIQDFLDA